MKERGEPAEGLRGCPDPGRSWKSGGKGLAKRASQMRVQLFCRLPGSGSELGRCCSVGGRGPWRRQGRVEREAPGPRVTMGVGGLRPGEGGSRADCCPPRIVGRCCRGWLGARRQCGQAEILRGREERPWETPGHEAQSAEPPLRIVSPEPVCPPGTSVSSRGRAHGTRHTHGVGCEASMVRVRGCCLQ